MLSRLQARYFRNLAPVDWRPGPGRHLLLGDNGAGKTSLLEAIYVLATTRSFRAGRLADCVRHGEDAFYLLGETAGRADLAVSWQEGARRRTLNGTLSPLADHLAALPVVLWTAADAETLTGAPQLRRRLLDRGVLGLKPGALEVLVRYRRALGQKRRLLAEGGRELAPWNAVLAVAAAELIAQRQRYVALLGSALDEVLSATGSRMAGVELDYRCSPPEAAGADAGPEVVEESLASVAAAERRRAMPLVGPHRDELAIRWRGRALKRTASAGERKALGLALAAAHGRVLAAAGTPPVYLLDDIDAELSETTLGSVWKAWERSDQILVTSNRWPVWKGLETERRWRLDEGRLDEA